jgi:hypothetical protein
VWLIAFRELSFLGGCILLERVINKKVPYIVHNEGMFLKVVFVYIC